MSPLSSTNSQPISPSLTPLSVERFAPACQLLLDPGPFVGCALAGGAVLEIVLPVRDARIGGGQEAARLRTQWRRVSRVFLRPQNSCIPGEHFFGCGRGCVELPRFPKDPGIDRGRTGLLAPGSVQILSPLITDSARINRNLLRALWRLGERKDGEQENCGDRKSESTHNRTLRHTPRGRTSRSAVRRQNKIRQNNCQIACCSRAGENRFHLTWPDAKARMPVSTVHFRQI